jgi:hypothetical protein
MKIAEKRIIECLPEVPGTSFDFKGVYVDAAGASHNVEVFDTSYFMTNVIQLFRNRRMVVDEDSENYLASLFSTWKASRENLYLKQAYAYTLKYNPIENYASREEMTNDVTETEHGHQIETTPADFKDEKSFPTERKTETTPYNTKETTTPHDDTSTHSTKGFNSQNFVEVDKDVRSGYVETETTHPGVTKETVSETVNGKETIAHTSQSHEIVENTGTDTVTRNYLLTKSGNIGVQTAAEMLQREYDGLKQDLAYRALSEFIDRYTYYCESVEGGW